MTELQEMPLHIQEAKLLGHKHVGCEHLLLGVLANEDSDAAKVLAAHGVTLDAARRRIAEICDAVVEDGEFWTYTPHATVVLGVAEVEAERLDHHEPVDVHLVLALITDGTGVPSALFDESAADIDRLIEDLVGLLDVPEQTREIYLRQRHATQRKRRPPHP